MLIVLVLLLRFIWEKQNLESHSLCKDLVGISLQTSDPELGEILLGTGVLAWDSSKQGPWARRWVQGVEGDSLQHQGELLWGLVLRGSLILSLSQRPSNGGTETLHTASHLSGIMSFLKTKN